MHILRGFSMGATFGKRLNHGKEVLSEERDRVSEVKRTCLYSSTSSFPNCRRSPDLPPAPNTATQSCTDPFKLLPRSCVNIPVDAFRCRSYSSSYTYRFPLDFNQREPYFRFPVDPRHVFHPDSFPFTSHLYWMAKDCSFYREDHNLHGPHPGILYCNQPHSFYKAPVWWISTTCQA